MCQINTEPMTSQKGYLQVVGKNVVSALLLFTDNDIINDDRIKRVSVPPKVIDEESSMDLVVKEGSDMLLQCKARGYPEPYIMWRREDGLDINYNGIVGKTNGEILSGVQKPQPLYRHYVFEVNECTVIVDYAFVLQLTWSTVKG